MSEEREEEPVVDAEATEIKEPPEPTLEETVAAAAEKAGLEVNDADDYKPSSTELVVAPGRDVFQVMDRADEIQILDELQSRPIKEMVYSFTDAGKRTTGLSYGGVREVVRTLNRNRYTGIRTSPDHPPIIEEFTEDGIRYYRVQTFAADLATGSGQWGIAQEPKRMVLTADTQGRWKSKGKAHLIDEHGAVWDKFALTKCFNKSQRNAMFSLLPIEFIEVIKAQFLGDVRKVREIQAGPGAEQLATLPPPLDDEKMQMLQSIARGKYDELKALNRLRMLPARFNTLLTNVAHSHERTEDFIAHLESEIEAEKAEQEAA